MKLNPGKCKDVIVDFLHFNTSVMEPIVIGAAQVEIVSSFKLLGYITNHLTWFDILLFYCTIIGSILEYASVVFANLQCLTFKTQCFGNDLEKVQKRALSIIYPNSSDEDALKVAGIDSLELRRNVACKKFVVETILPGNPLYPIIHNCPEPQYLGYSLRANNVAKKIKSQTDRFRNFVTVMYACSKNFEIEHNIHKKDINSY